MPFHRKSFAAALITLLHLYTPLIANSTSTTDSFRVTELTVDAEGLVIEFMDDGPPKAYQIESTEALGTQLWAQTGSNRFTPLGNQRYSFELDSSGAEGFFYRVAQLEMSAGEDPDMDGLATYFEASFTSDAGSNYYSNPNLSDTDGDGFSDRDEYIAGSRINDINDIPSLNYARTDPSLASINADGWTGNFLIEDGAVPEIYGNRFPFDADTIENAVRVTRSGYNSNGQPQRLDQIVPITTEVRTTYDPIIGSAEDYPLQRIVDTGGAMSLVALGEFIYASDIVYGAENHSTKAAPTPQFMWLHPDYITTVDGVLTVSAVVAHAHPMNGSPVAAVRFIISDGENSVECLVNTMTYLSYSASGLGSPAYQAAIDVSGLNDGELLVDAIIYPWIGEAFQLSTDGIPSPAMQVTTLNAYKGTMPTYAYVSEGGNDETGVASTNPDTAQALPFATLSSAGTAISTIAGDASGGVIRFEPGVYGVSSTSSLSTPSAPLTFEATDAANVATTILTDTSTSVIGANLPSRVVMRNLTFQKTDSGNSIFSSPTADSSLLSIENCRFDRNGQSYQQTWIRRGGRVWYINCESVNGDIGIADSFGSNVKNVNLIGCSDIKGRSLVNIATSRIAGNIDIVSSFTASPRTSEGGGVFFSYFSSAGNDPTLSVNGDFLTNTSLGIAVVGSIFEKLSDQDVNINMFASGGGSPASNINVQMNTSVGDNSNSGINFLYNDSGSSPKAQDATFRCNAIDRMATKTDMFADNADLIGNWPGVFKVGHDHTTVNQGTNMAASNLGPGSWRREVENLGFQFGDGGSGVLDPRWTDDQTNSGGGNGFGDYTPLADSPLQRVPALYVPYPYDIYGRPIPMDGTAFVGALQRP